MSGETELLRNTRIAREMTMRNIANKVGITERWYRLIERGERTPALEVITEILRVLEIPHRQVGTQDVYAGDAHWHCDRRLRETDHEILVDIRDLLKELTAALNLGQKGAT